MPKVFYEESSEDMDDSDIKGFSSPVEKNNEEQPQNLEMVVFEDHTIPDTSFHSMSKDIILYMSTFFDPRTIARVESLEVFNRRFKQAEQYTNQRWKNFVLAEVSENPQIPPGMTYKQYYGEFYKTKLRLQRALNKPKTDTDEYLELFVLIIKNNFDKLGPLLLKKVNVNTELKEAPYTLLHVAAFHGSNHFVPFLIDQGAKINISFGNQIRTGRNNSYAGRYNFVPTPLSLAAREGNAQCVETLIANQAHVDIISGKTADRPLHEAAANGHVDCLKLLIEAHANVNVINKLGNTPLHLAAQGGHLECLKLLVQANAILNAPNDEGYCAIHLVSPIKHPECYDYLAEQMQAANLNIPEGPGIFRKFQNLLTVR